MDKVYALVRHKVADYDRWYEVYAQDTEARIESGFHEMRIFSQMDDPNNVFILFEVDDLEKAKERMDSQELRDKMQEAGVMDKPDFYFLT
jgi:hypothetical protein